ncbi:MAG: DNA helicase IV [Enterobacteriaceae bacterium]
MLRMELKATALGRHLAQHPYNSARLLPAGVEVSGSKHCAVIPFKDLVAVRCKRGLVWGELEFELPDTRVVRLHGTEWQETKRFHEQLMQHWLQWDQEVIPIAQGLLNERAHQLYQLADNLEWLTWQRLQQIVTDIHITLQGLPLPQQRLPDLIQCAGAYALCQQWLQQGEEVRRRHNERCYEILSDNYRPFFSRLNREQGAAILCTERWVDVRGGVGSGKSELLLAKSRWLQQQQSLSPEQIVLLVQNSYAVDEMNYRRQLRGDSTPLSILTFDQAALQIVQWCRKQPVQLSQLEQVEQVEQMLLIQCWQQQCADKRAYARSWQQWLREEMDWPVPEERFWQDPELIARLIPRLQRWLRLVRMQGGAQGDIVQMATEEAQPILQKQLRLMAPLLKAYKGQLKEEGAVDSPRLLKLAADCLSRRSRSLPWSYLLVDDLHNCSPAQTELLSLLINKGLSLMTVADPAANSSGFSDQRQQLHILLQQKQIEAEPVFLTDSWRPPQSVRAVAHYFLDPYGLGNQKRKVDRFLPTKKPVIALPQEMLSALLDKLSGTVSDNECVLLLTRYSYMQPGCLLHKATRWPKLSLHVMTIDACSSIEADIVILCGLSADTDGFPVSEGVTVLEETLLPESGQLPAGLEQRLFYKALTLCKKQVWLLYDPQQPSLFMQQLGKQGVEYKKRP